MKMVKLPSPMLASVTMCNDDYNTKISDLGYLTINSCNEADGER